MMSSRDDVHGALNIEPDGGFAAEEGEGRFREENTGEERAISENYQIGLLGYHNDEDKKIPRPFDGGFSILID